jgi:Holliday junction resolvase RusA-like endonuclease
MITLYGQVPSLKNNKQLFINKRTGKHFITSSKSSKDWTSEAINQLAFTKPIKDYPILLHATFYCKDNRRRDLDNMLSTVLDALRHAGILEDDSWQFIPKIVVAGLLDKENPRVELSFDIIDKQ